MELISVIISVYNTEKYLKKCIESVINQTYKNIEIILINDGSIDNSEMICRNFSTQNNKIRYFQQCNSGVSAARNKGIEVAQGQYILFIDSDDWIEPKMIEFLLNNMKLQGTDISCCQYDRGNLFHNNGTQIWSREEVLKKFLIHKQINGSLVNKLIKKELISDLRLDKNIKYGEDALFLWKLLLKVNSVSISDTVLYHVTLHDDSASGGGSYKPIRRDVIKVWGEILEDAKYLGNTYEKIAAAQLANMAFYSLYEMGYYHYYNKLQEKQFLTTLKKNYPYLKMVDFIPKQEMILANIMIYNMKLARKLIQLRNIFK